MGFCDIALIIAALIVGFDSAPTRLLDMSHTLDEHSIIWGLPAQKKVQVEDFSASLGINETWSANNIEMGEHVGTHIDSPAHMKRAGGTQHVHDIPLDRLTGAAVRIDIRNKLSASHYNYEVTSQDLIAFEDEHGNIPEGAIVVLCSGWSDNVNSLQEYWGNEAGDILREAPSFPGFGKDSASWLIHNRDIRGLATDTGSCDVGNTVSYDAHRVLFAENAWCIEGLANTCELPAQGATIYAFPMKIRDASGIPLRVVASWKDTSGERSITMGKSDL